MDDLAGVLPLIAAHRFGWLQCRELVDAEPSQDAADGRRRHVDLDRNLLARVALAAQSLNDRACRRRCLGLAMKEAWRSGRANHRHRLRGTVRPIWRPSSV